MTPDVRPSGLAPVGGQNIDPPEADRHLAPLLGRSTLLAVSGGVDSVALMGLAADWARRHRQTIHVAVVDHGLRDASAAEADFVVNAARQLALSAAVLSWRGIKPQTAVQAKARDARYRLLTQHARELGADTLVTAHTLDDQAETLLIRLAAGSGPAGLAGMRANSTTHGLSHLRPLLSVPRHRLIATCQSRGWGWIEDPSNEDLRFARVRWRRLMPLVAREGLTAARLGLLARRMTDTEAALQQISETVLRRVWLGADDTGMQVDGRALLAEPAVIAGRVLGLLLANRDAPGSVTDGADGPPERHGPRLVRIESGIAALAKAVETKTALTRTLGGFRLALGTDGRLIIAREAIRRRGCVNRVLGASLGNGLS